MFAYPNTGTHIVLPKTGYETELKQIQSELAKQPNNPELAESAGNYPFQAQRIKSGTFNTATGNQVGSPDNSILHNNLGFIYLIIEDDRARPKRV